MFWEERVPGADHLDTAELFEAAHRSQAGLQPSVIGFDRVVRISLGDVTGGGYQLIEHPRVGGRAVSGDLGGGRPVPECAGEESPGGDHVPLLGDQHVDDLPELIDRPIQSENRMFHSTTILAVRHRDHAVLAGDGQVTFGQTVVKHGAKKIRRLYNDRVLAGFAGSAADSFALFSRFEAKLEQYRGNLERSAVELAKDWRSDRILRRLEAMLIVLDKTATFLLSGNGDLFEPDDGIVAIGSGGPYALAAAKALAQNTDLDARAIAEKAMTIAGEICIYTNANIAVEEL